MSSYEFSSAKIVRWMEKVGADVRPPIEIPLEQVHLQDFSTWARRELPQVFDRMLLGEKRFEMLKTLEYPGKPPVDIATLVMTPRGPVFTVPQRISEVDLEPADLPGITDVFCKCMRRLLKCLPGRRVIRVGKINEYIFDCDGLSSLPLVAQRFSKLTIPDDGELNLRFNVPDQDYNRIFTIAPMEARRISAPNAPLERVGFGINVTVDVNNRQVGEPLEEARWMTILHAADLYNREGIYDILNSGGEGHDRNS